MFERVLARNGAAERRWRIEHAQHQLAQAEGHRGGYAHFELRIERAGRAYGMERPRRGSQ